MKKAYVAVLLVALAVSGCGSAGDSGSSARPVDDIRSVDTGKGNEAEPSAGGVSQGSAGKAEESGRAEDSQAAEEDDPMRITIGGGTFEEEQQKKLQEGQGGTVGQQVSDFAKEADEAWKRAEEKLPDDVKEQNKKNSNIVIKYKGTAISLGDDLYSFMERFDKDRHWTYAPKRGFDTGVTSIFGSDGKVADFCDDPVAQDGSSKFYFRRNNGNYIMTGFELSGDYEVAGLTKESSKDDYVAKFGNYVAFPKVDGAMQWAIGVGSKEARMGVQADGVLYLYDIYDK